MTIVAFILVLKTRCCQAAVVPGVNNPNENQVANPEVEIISQLRGIPNDRSSGEVSNILDNMIAELERIFHGAKNHKEETNSRRNRLAFEAANNNLNDARGVRHLRNSEVVDRLRALFEHTKYWEHRFIHYWGAQWWVPYAEFNNAYAGWCHGEAKKYYNEALLAVQELRNKFISGKMQMVPKLQITDGGKNTGEFELEVQILSGYTREEKVSTELHSKIAAEASGTAAQYLANASVSAEVRGQILSSSSIVNKAEYTEKVKIKVSLSEPIYIYQTKFSVTLGDDSTFSAWGSGWIISSKPLVFGDVCHHITTVTGDYGFENSWTFGSCSSDREYLEHSEFTQRCCQPAGNYELTCKCSYGDGWHGGYLKVGGSTTKICKDFTDGSEQKQNIDF